MIEQKQHKLNAAALVRRGPFSGFS